MHAFVHLSKPLPGDGKAVPVGGGQPSEEHQQGVVQGKKFSARRIGSTAFMDGQEVARIGCYPVHFDSNRMTVAMRFVATASLLAAASSPAEEEPGQRNKNPGQRMFKGR